MSRQISLRLRAWCEFGGLFMRACEGVRVGHACIYTYMYTYIHIYVIDIKYNNINN